MPAVAAAGTVTGIDMPLGLLEAGRDQRRALLGQAGIALPAVPRAPVTDTLDAAAVAWSTWRIATGQAVVLPATPRPDGRGREIAIRY
jgi:predicted RNase H-like nuclease